MGSLPGHSPELAEEALLREAVDLFPQRLTVGELAARIVSDPGDSREVEIAAEATRDLRRSGLLRYRSDDQVVGPTQAALRAHALLTR